MNHAHEFALALTGKTLDNVHKKVIAQMYDRMRAQGIQIRGKNGRPTMAALREQASYIAGVGSALHHLLDHDTEFVGAIPSFWVLVIARGELIEEPLRGEKQS